VLMGVRRLFSGESKHLLKISKKDTNINIQLILIVI
jgi:hypothetical protein